jgi:hypothetical protein
VLDDCIGMLEEARALFQNDCDNTNNNVTRAKANLTDAEKTLMLLKKDVIR